jgi:hypothetical protein
MNRFIRLFGVMLSSLIFVAGSAVLSHSLAPTLPVHSTTSLLPKPIRNLVAPHSGGALLTKDSLSVLGGPQSAKSIEHTEEADFNLLLPGPGSLATRHVRALINAVVENGIKVGEAQGASQLLITSYNVVGGNLQGTLYLNNSLNINVGPAGATYSFGSFGSFNGTVGVIPDSNTELGHITGTSPTPNFQNTLLLTPNFASIPIRPINLGLSVGLTPVLSPEEMILLARAPGSQRGFLTKLYGLSAQSVLVGQQIGLKNAIAALSKPVTFTLQGGYLQGAIFEDIVPELSVNDFLNTKGLLSQYVFAFGNNPLNNPSGPAFTHPSPVSTIVLANGTSYTISSGQFVFPLFGGANGAQLGTLLTFGANPNNNTGVGGVVNPTSFIHF